MAGIVPAEGTQRFCTAAEGGGAPVCRYALDRGHSEFPSRPTKRQRNLTINTTTTATASRTLNRRRSEKQNEITIELKKKKITSSIPWTHAPRWL